MKLVLTLLFPAICFGQALHYNEGAARGDNGWVGNAVYIGGGRALTVGHMYHGPETRRREVDGRHVEITRYGKRVTLLGVTPKATWKSCLISKEPPKIGQRLIHRWRDTRTRELHERYVRWARWNHIDQPFKVGMSGSGVYTVDGQLVALAEATDGLCQPLSEIRLALGL